MTTIISTERDLPRDVRAIAQDIARTHADQVDHEARFPREAVTALQEAGTLSALVPQSLGGEGQSLREVANACYELGRCCSASAMVFAMHQIQVATIVRHLEPGSWFEGYLRELVDSQRLIASVTSEMGTGGDMGRSIAAVQPAGVDGIASFEKQAPTVSYGGYADDLLTTVRRGPEALESDQVMVLHRASETVMEPTGTWDTLGMRGTCSPGFVVKARFAPEQTIDLPFSQVMNESVVPISHILWTHAWLGIATEAFERGRAFVRAAAKRSPGKPVPAAAALSRVMAELTLLRGTVSGGIAEFERADHDGDRSAFAKLSSQLYYNNLKLSASEQAPRVCGLVLEVIGIMAYKNDSPFGVGRQLRDSMSARLMVANERIHQTDAGLLMIAKEV